MVRACKGAGAGLRANSSLAGVAGSSGLASGGSGFGLTVPLSCAAALKGRSDAANSHRAARGAILRQGAPLGAFIIVMLAPIESCPSELAPAFESAPGSRWGRVNRGSRPVQPVHDSLVCRNCEQVPHHHRSSPNPLRAAISGLVGRALRRQHDISHGRTDAWLDRPAGVAVHSITISPTMPWSAWLLPSAATIPQRKSVTRPAATGTNHHSAVCPG